MSSIEIMERTLSETFLAFYLNKKSYAFSILKVNEVIVLPEIIPMPKTPGYMKGVINLRGQIIPIIDLKLALNMQETEYTEETCVIIVKMQIKDLEKMVGFIIDNVSEVFEIASSDIEKSPGYGNQQDDDFIKGIGKVKDQIIILLDIDKILSKKVSEEFVLTESEDNNTKVDR